MRAATWFASQGASSSAQPCGSNYESSTERSRLEHWTQRGIQTQTQSARAEPCGRVKGACRQAARALFSSTLDHGEEDGAAGASTEFFSDIVFRIWRILSRRVDRSHLELLLPRLRQNVLNWQRSNDWNDCWRLVFTSGPAAAGSAVQTPAASDASP